jgi:hypothetical protein
MKPTQGPGAVKGNYYARFRRSLGIVANDLLVQILGPETADRGNRLVQRIK